MGRPKKVVTPSDPPKRRGRPPKKLTAQTASAPKEKEGKGKKARKYSQPSSMTFRIDGKLRAKLKKTAEKEYTSESSLANKFIEFGLNFDEKQWVQMERRLAVAEKQLGIVVEDEEVETELEAASDDEGEAEDTEVASDDDADEDSLDEDEDLASAATTDDEVAADEDEDLDSDEDDDDEIDDEDEDAEDPKSLKNSGPVSSPSEYEARAKSGSGN